MKYDEKNIIIENVLLENEIDDIYESIKNPNNHYVMKRFNQTISDFRLSDSIANKIIKYCENISGETDLQITEYQFSKYEKITNVDGTIGYPNLTPHYDETFKQPRFTFDYQLRSNTDWPIIVEEKEFILKDNQALTFSGTHQIHWRSKKIFEDGEFIDMMFVHLTKRGSENITQDIINTMNIKANKFKELYNRMDNNRG